MQMDKPDLRGILIGGTSNVGKSTLAQAIAARRGGQWTSTDSLGRHPGRPWGTVRPHVAEHYATLAVDELIADVLRHYRGLWPGIEQLVAAHASDPARPPLILEGSALWPESVASLRLPGVGALWLTASDTFLQGRIYAGSGYAQAPPEARLLVDKFLARTLRYDELMLRALARLGLPWLNVEAAASLDDLADQALRLLAQGPAARPHR